MLHRPPSPADRFARPDGHPQASSAWTLTWHLEAPTPAPLQADPPAALVLGPNVLDHVGPRIARAHDAKKPSNNLGEPLTSSGRRSDGPAMATPSRTQPIPLTRKA
jgi:hypothetical protein